MASATPPPGTYGRQAFLTRQAQGFPAGPVNYGNDGKSTLANAEGYAYELIKGGDKNADSALTAEEWAPQFGGDLTKAQQYLKVFDANENGKLEGAEAMLMIDVSDNPATSLFGGAVKMAGLTGTEDDNTYNEVLKNNPAVENLFNQANQILDSQGSKAHERDGIISVEEQNTLDQFLTSNAAEALHAEVKGRLEGLKSKGNDLYQEVNDHFAIYDEFPMAQAAAPVSETTAAKPLPAGAGDYGREAFLSGQSLHANGDFVYGDKDMKDGSPFVNATGYAYELIRNHDTDNDRALTAQEWSAQFDGDIASAQQYVRALDANDNGKVDAVELAVFINASDSPEAFMTAAASTLIDTNQDGKYSSSESQVNPVASALMTDALKRIETIQSTQDYNFNGNGIITASERTLMNQYVTYNPEVIKAGIKTAIAASETGQSDIDKLFSLYDQHPLIPSAPASGATQANDAARLLPLTSGFSTTAVPQNYMQALTMMALLAVLTSLMGNSTSQTQPSIQF